MASKKDFFEQQIKDQQPKKVKAEVVWRPTAQTGESVGGHGASGFKAQTKKQLNLGPPPAKKSFADLP